MISVPPKDIICRLNTETLFDRETKQTESKRRLVEKFHRDQLYDQKSLRPFFKPEINPDAKSRPRPENMTVYSHLYGMRHFKQLKINNMILSEQKDQILGFAKSSEASNKVLEDKQNQKLEMVFEYFDVDCDGYINNSDIEAVVPNLPADMLELMSVLVDESKQGEIKLKKDEWLNSMNFLLKVFYFIF